MNKKINSSNLISKCEPSSKRHSGDKSFVFEELEPRLLLSADGLGVITASSVDTFHDLINDENQQTFILQEFSESASASLIVDVNKNTSPSAARTELVIIDSRAPNFQQLHNDVLKAQQQGRDINVVILDAHRDGIQQISEAISKYNKLDAIHIVSHGKDAQLELGTTQLNKQTLKQRSEEIAQWQDVFTERGDVLIYGCNLAESADGTALVNSLSKITGADVAASDDLTGNSILGGDWDLEYKTGDIETSLAFSTDVQESWKGTLNTAAPAVNDQQALATEEQEAAQEIEQQAELDTVLLAEEEEAETSLQQLEQQAEQQGSEVQEQRQEIVFIDESVTDYQSFIDDLQNNSDGSTTFEIIVLDSDTDGIEQISNVLSAYDDVDAIHVFSHGDDGTVKLGNTWLSADNIGEYSDSLNIWANSLDIDADILIYGCNLAESESGEQFVNQLASLTNADVAASDDLTGSAILGGDWELEYQQGSIETDVAVSAELQQSWNGVLADTTTNLVAHYSFDIDGHDSSGNLNDGTLQGGAFIDTNNGTDKVGEGKLSLDGSGDYVDLTSSLSSFSSLTNGTISAWVNVANGDNSEHTIFTVDGNSTNYAYLYVDNGNLEFNINDGGTTVLDVSSTSTINDGNWHHVAFSSSDTGNALYIDGVQLTGGAITYAAGTSSTTTFIADLNTTTTASIGAYLTPSFGGDFNGLIDDVRIYSEAVSSGVITALANENISNTYIVSTTADSGPGSLRQAILDANANAGVTDTITFDIGADGSQQTINLLTALNPITDTVIIDGSSQYGALTPTTPLIEINGTNTTGADGFRLVTGSDDNIIQGLIINNFDGDGIYIESDNNVITGNYIGTNAAGTADVGNGAYGINIFNGAGNTIGGITDVDRNVISGNDDDGIMLYGAGTTGNVIEGNYIGTNAAGTASIGNADTGISIENTASNNTIGGALATERNIISGNGTDGVYIENSSNNTVLGNYIGTDVTGTLNLGNIRYGVTLYDGASSNTIGGSVAGAGNVISGNNNDAIVIDGNGGSTTDNNIISGNYIGTDKDGTGSLGNSGDGITISNGADNNTVGGTVAGEGNIIANNGSDGIDIKFDAGIGNAILGNSIFSNVGMGIDIDVNGVQANDSGDGDTGANNLQNYPVLSSANTSGTDITIIGSFNSTANSYYRIEFFASTSGDASGNGEAETYLGYANIATDGSGNATINVTLIGVVADGAIITATATESDASYTSFGSTSEFAQNVQATSFSTLADNFDDGVGGSTGYTGNDGTQSWVGDWAEVGDTNNRINVVDKNGGGDWRLLIQGDGSVKDYYVSREADLSGSTYATLTYDYEQDNSYDAEFAVEIRDGDTGWTQVAYYNPAGGNFVGSETISIAANLRDSGNTEIRFRSAIYTDPEFLYIDNIQIEHDGGVTNNAPVNSVPTAQATNEDTALIFNTANGNLISISDVDAAANSLEVTLSVNDGTLTLSGTSELTFTSGSNGSATMTIQGTLSNINTALDGLIYTPTANYNGSDTLSLNTLDSELVSLNIDANLLGHYSFDDTGDLGNDSSSAGANDGVIVGATTTIDGTHGDVLDFDGNDYVQITGLYGQPADVTLSAWVNLTTAAPNASQVISLGDSVILQVDNSEGGAFGVSGAWYDGAVWNNITTGTFIEGTGWHHVAYAFDDTNNLQTIYIDGVAVITELVTTSISYAQGVDTFIGTHATGQVGYDFTGQVDDARIYDRVLTAEEIANLADDINLIDTDSVAITVNAVNDAPTTGNTSSGIPEDPVYAQVNLNGTDIDGTVTHFRLNNLPANGILYLDSGLTTAVSAGVDYVKSGALLPMYFVPDTNWNGITTFDYVAKDDQGVYSVAPGTATINITAVNDAPVSSSSAAYTSPDNTYTFSVSDFNFSDVDTADSLQQIRITGITGSGALTLSSVSVSNNDVISVADIIAGNLQFTPAAGESGTNYASFNFEVHDGSVYAAASSSVTINVSGLSPSYFQRVQGGGIAVDSAGMRQEASFIGGTLTPTLTISGVPVGASIIDAFLYVNELDFGAIDSTFTLNGSNVTMTEIGSSSDPAWGANRVVTFKADVSSIVTGNGSFTLGGANGIGFDSYEGAVLVVVYEDLSAASDSLITLHEGSVTFRDLDDFDQPLSFNNGSSLPAAVISGSTTLVTFDGQDSFSENGVSFQATTAGAATSIISANSFGSDNGGSEQFTVDITGLISQADSGATLSQQSIVTSDYLVYPFIGTVIELQNSAPVANNVSSSANEDSASIIITLTGTDSDGSVDNFRLNGLPANGTLYLDAGLSTVASTGADYTATAESLTLYFKPDLNWNGNTTFDFVAKDNNGLQSASAATATITVNAVNDAATATNLNIAESYTEDTSINLIDIVVSDIDSANTTVTLTLSDIGAGSLSTATSGAVTSTFVGGVWTASGAIADVNILLASVSFNPLLNYNSNFSITTSVDDGAAPAVTGAKAMTGNAVNDAPVIVTNNPLSIPEEATRTITTAYLEATDVDNTSDQIVFTLTNLPSGGSVRLSGSSLGLGGTFTQDDINNNRITYRDNDSGSTTSFQLTVSDGTVTLPAITFSLNGAPINDTPVNTTPVNVTTMEEIATAIGGISIIDIDANGGNLTTRLQVNNGNLNVTLAGSATISVGANDSNDLTILGTVVDINATLISLAYTGNTDVTGINADTLTMTTNDLGNTGSGGALQDVDTVQIDINNVNDTPTATNLNAAESYTEETPLNLTNIVVSDVDSTNVTVILTLSDIGAGNLSTAISGSVTSTFVGGVWTASGAIADVNILLAGVTFNPALNYDSNFSIATSVDDGVAPAVMGAKVITATAVNDAPTATNINAAEAYTEDSILNLIDIVVSDIDSANTTVTLTLSDIGAGSLSTATSGAVTSTFVGGVWTASGAIVDVNVLLAGVTFNPTLNYNTNFSITTSIDDGLAPAVTGAKAFTATAVNDTPTASNLNTAETYTEDTPLNLTDIVVSDVDSSNTTVTLTLSDIGSGTLSTATSGAVTSTFVGGVWTASGVIANVNILLAGVTFSPTLNYNSNFSIATSVDDGVAAVITGTKVVTATAVNDAPTASNLSAAESYTEDTSINLIDIVVSDIDSANTTVTLTLSDISAGNLSTTTSGSVTSTFVGGVWTASGAIADVNVLLAGVTFNPTLNYSSNFSIATSVDDGVAPAVTGAKAFTATAVNDAPTASNLSAAESYTEDTVLNLINIVVSDVDSANTTVMLTLSDIGAGSLSTATSGAVTSAFVGGVWTASGAIADVNILLAGVTFNPTLNYNSNFSIATSVDDGVAPAATGSKVITALAVNDVPILDLNGVPAGIDFTTIFVEGGGPTNITAAAVSLIDVDNSVLNSIVVNLTNRLDPASKESLSANVGATSLTAVWSSTTDTLTISGVFGTVADYLSVLATVQYDNTAQNPDATTRIITFVANDGTGDSVLATTTLNITAVNNAPTATNLSAAQTYIEDIPLDLTDIVVTDVDSVNTTVTLTLSDVAAGSLSTATSNAVTSTFVGGVWTASGAVADVNILLAGVNFNPAANYNSNFTVATSVDDGVAAPVTGTKAITGTAVNDAPVGTSGSVTALEDTPYQFIIADFGFTDVNDSHSFLAVEISTLPNALAGTLTLTGSGNVTIGQVITVADIVAGKLVFTATNADANGTNFASFNFRVQDNGGVVNGGSDIDATQKTLQINVSAVNDVPAATVPGSQTVTEFTNLTFSTANTNALSIFDLEAGTVEVTLTATNGLLSLSGITGLAFNTGTGTGDAVMTFSGSQLDVNNALEGMTFISTVNHFGAGSVQLDISDLGSTGIGGVLTDSQIVAITITTVSGGPPNGDAFLQGDFIEVGISGDGAFGSNDVAPAGYVQSGSQLGIIGDRDKDGWATYDGDYVLAGTFEEGWGVHVGGTDYNNNNILASQITGSLNNFVDTGTSQSVDWNGNVSGLDIDATYSIDKSGQFVEVYVYLTNTTGSALNDVYYMRNVDPDNNNNQGSPDAFLTTNTIVSQGNDGSSIARVEATQSDGSYLGLVGFGDNARVTQGGFSNRSAQDVYNGTGGLNQTGTNTADQAISLAFNYATISAGETVALRYQYIIATPTGPGVDLDLDGNAGALGAGYQTTFTEGGAAVNIADSDAIVFDPDSANLTSMTVALSSNPDGALEILSANTSGTLIGLVYNSATGVLTLSGSDTVANYQQVLRTITYNNTSSNPDATDRVIQVTVNDGVNTSNIATSTITIASVNDAPTATNLSVAETYTEDTVLNLTDIVVSDVDSANTTVTLTLSDLGAGSLSTATSGFVTSTFVGGVWTANGAIADVNILLAGLTFNPTLNYNANFSITTSVDDGVAPAVTGSKSFTAIAVNDAPVLAAIGNQTTDELVNLSFTATATDVDLPADTLTFSLDVASLAAGMTIDANTGVFSWTPTEGQGGSIPSVTVTVTDSGTGNLIDSETFTVTVNDVNVAPVLGVIGNQSVDELATLTFTATATDSDLPADTLTFTLDAASLALGMSIDVNTGVFSWTPTEGQGGSTPSVTVTVTDSGTGNLIDSETFTVTVNDVNVAPVLGVIGNQSVDELATLSFTATATDSDLPADTLTFTLDAASLALGMSIDVNTGVFSWTPTEGQGGSIPSVTVTVTDSGTGNLIDSETFTVTVNDVNVAPVLGAIGNQSIDELATLSFTATATDSDLPADTLTFTLDATSLALGMSIDVNTGVFSWTPTEGQGGSAPSVTVTVTDNGTGNLIDSETFTVTVNDVNVAPVLGVIGNQSIDELATLTFTATATDSDLPADTLTFSLDATSLAAGMTIDANTGVFSWIPTEGQGGSAPSVTVTVTDNGTGNLIDSETFTVTVNDVNVAPVLGVIGNQSIDELATLSFTATATDSDLPADTLTFSLDAASLAAGMTIDVNTGVFSWTPTEGQGGLIPSVTVTVTDSGTGNLIDSETFTVTVNDVNVAPVLGAIGNQSIDELATLSFTATATDSDLPADTLTFTLDAASLALGMSIDVNTGVFSWAPTEGQGGLIPSVTVTVTDNGTGNLIDSETFTVTVNDVNVAPVLGAIGNQSIDELATLSFTATATDSDLPADTLTFSLDAASLAAGMTIDVNTGLFSWTPTTLQGNTVPSVTITVTDNGTGNLIDSETFTIAVNDLPLTFNDSGVGFSTSEDTGFTTGNVLANDELGDPVSVITAFDGVSVNGASITYNNDGTFNYNPAANFNGSDSFTYTLTDNDGDMSTATVTINVIAVNDPAVIAGVDTGLVTEDNDPDGDNLLETTGALTISDVDVGEASFIAGTLVGTFGDITIDAAGNWSYAADNTQAAIQNLAVGATLTDTISITSFDGTAHNIVITINGTNDAAIIAGVDTGAMTEDLDPDADTFLEASGLLTISDIDTGEASFVANTSMGTYGALTINAAGNWSYAADNTQVAIQSLAVGATLTDTISITSFDGTTHNIVLTITGVNDAPVAVNDTPASVNEGGVAIFDLAANDTDIDNTLDLNSIVITVAPTNGSLIVNGDGTVTYTHDGSETISDSFSYTIADISGAVSNVATVSFIINPVNDAPVAQNDNALTVDEGATANFDLAANDSDADDGLDLNSINIISAPLNGSLIVNSNGTVTYTHDSSETLTDSFTYTIADISGVISNVATANIVINPVNDAPMTVGITNVTVLEDASNNNIDLNAAFNDSDNTDSELTYSIVSNTNNGLFSSTIINLATGQLSLDYAADQNGSSQITVRAIDPSGASVDTLFTVNVTPVNDDSVVDVNNGVLITDISEKIINTSMLNSFDIDNTLSEITYTITNLPGNGVLLLNGVVLATNDSFTQADLVNGNVSYQLGFAPSGNDQFGFTVSDGSSTLSAMTFNITISLTPVDPGDPGDPGSPEPEEPVDPDEVDPIKSVSLPEAGDPSSGTSGSTMLDQLVQSLTSGVEILKSTEINETRDSDLIGNMDVTNYNLKSASSLEDIQVKSIKALWMALDKMQEQINEHITENMTDAELKAAVVSSSGVALTAGVVAWVLRSGALMTSLISTIPLWKGYDPMPILAKQDEDDEEDDLLKEKVPTSLDEMKKQKELKEKMKTYNQVDSMFGGLEARE